MNFDKMDRQDGVTVELKYCERCGGLWLRRKGMTGVYCGGCRARLAEMVRTRRAEAASERKRPTPVRVGWLLGVAEMGVRA